MNDIECLAALQVYKESLNTIRKENSQYASLVELRKQHSEVLSEAIERLHLEVQMLNQYAKNLEQQMEKLSEQVDNN